MARTVADNIIETLDQSGVHRVYGIPGDSLNGFTDALRRDGRIEWVHARHEEGAAFAASGEAALTGELARWQAALAHEAELERAAAAVRDLERERRVVGELLTAIDQQLALIPDERAGCSLAD